MLGCVSETRSRNAAVDVAYPAEGQKLGWDRRIWTRWVLHASVFVELYVACAVCSVRRAHDAGHGCAEHMCSRREPLETRGLLWDVQGDVMAARVVGIRQEGIKSLPDGAVRGGTRCVNSGHDVMQKVRGCELPRWCAGCELPRWWCAIKKINK